MYTATNATGKNHTYPVIFIIGHVTKEGTVALALKYWETYR